MIKGYVDTREVYINGELLDPLRSQKVFNHSPDGFMWGYSGSGPAQLSLAILLEYLDDQLALKFYQDFKRDVIAGLSQNEDFELDESVVKTWVANKVRDLEPENKSIN